MTSAPASMRGFACPGAIDLSISRAGPGDAVLVSGTIGDHGVAILPACEGFEFETPLRSDSASLSGLTRAMLEARPDIRAMRDPTRGGVSSALNELAAASGVGVALDESAIRMRPGMVVLGSLGGGEGAVTTQGVMMPAGEQLPRFC